METNDLNLRIICRTCQSDSPEMELIFEASNNLDENLRIDEMLMECTSLQVLCEDGLPKYICQVCKAQLFSAYAFKKQCEKSYASFQETFNIPKNENATKRDYIQILDNTNQLLLTCCTCGKMFTTLDGLRCHKRIHTGHFFKCKECDKSYTRLAHLQRHEMAHDKKKAHMCKICNRILTRIEHLKRHLVTHLKDKPHVCAKCQRGFNRAEHLSSHSQKCSGAKVYSCDICNKAFSRKDSLDVHRQVHDGNMPVLPKIGNLDNIDEHYVEIDMDDKILSDNELSEEEYDLLDVEIEVRENVLVDVGKDLIKDEQPVTTIKQELDMETTFIDKSVQSENIILEGDTKAEVKDNYVDDEVNDSESVHSEYLPTKPKKRGRGRPRKHINKRPRGRPPSRKIKKECPHKEEGDDEPCEMCEDNKQDMNLDDNLLHICSICNKVFPRITYLKRHLNSHKIVKSYACDNCPKSFIKKAHLSQHMKSHVKSPLLPCDECDKIFRNVEHLTKHKERKHSGNEKLIGEKKFKCDVCEKAFTTEKYREVHMRSHTGEKTFKCRSCEKSFISKSHLTEHMKFHNDNSKKFLCSECGQRFIRNDYLVIHMRRHRGEKPFKCQYCGKGFPRTTDLTVHERYHTGEKTHLCTICGRGFGRAYNLTVHMRTHTGEKPYRCTYCDAAFAQGNDLKAHVRRHTGERFQCELCPETFLMGYLLTQHKRNVHGLNVVSNIRRLKPVTKLNSTGEPPITIPLPKPVIPTTINLPLNMV